MNCTPIRLNHNVAELVKYALFTGAEPLRVHLTNAGEAASILDFGIDAPGGLAAGLLLARVCMADLATIRLAAPAESPWPMIEVRTDHPVLACLASQYAGWEIKGDGYFAMGSGPMRAVAAREPLFEDIGYREKIVPTLNENCFGVLEASKLPPEAVFRDIATKCGVESNCLVLLVAPTRSLAGTIQIVARSVETAMHKLHELKFDLKRIESAIGSAPLPPPAADDLAAIGRTNDAILYGGRVTLYCRGDDASLAAIGEQVPSSASRDYGRPFAETLAAYDHDFYRVDPLLFSPAQITLVNLDTGRTFRFGDVNHDILSQSFGD
jgi:methenyltetrahydromethanopterin cyclohydrolase